MFGSHTVEEQKKMDVEESRKRVRTKRTTKRFYGKGKPRHQHVVTYRHGLPPLGGMPRSKMVRLRYCDIVALDPTAGGIAARVFRANSLFDPDFTGTGHQPLGFDQLMVYYNHFHVIGSKIKVDYTPSQTATVTEGYAPCLFGIILSDDGLQATGSSNVNHLLEQRSNQYDVKYGGTPLNNRDQTAIKTFSHKRFFRQPIFQNQYRGSSAANPDENAYFELWASTINSNDPASHVFTVTIEYLAILTEPKELPQS